MEVLYNVPLAVPKKPSSQVIGLSCASWSVDNKLALGLITSTKEVNHFAEQSLEYTAVILDPDRPWSLYSVVPVSGDSINFLSWSGNGRKLLSCSSNHKLCIWENNLSAINLWKCSCSVALPCAPLAVVWYETPKKFTVHVDRSSLDELLSARPTPHHMRASSGRVVLAVTEDGQLAVAWLQGGPVVTCHPLPHLGRPRHCHLLVLETGDVLCVGVTSSNVVLLYRVFIGPSRSVTVNSVAQWQPSVAGTVNKVLLISDDSMFEVHLVMDNMLLEKWVLTEIQLGLQPTLVQQSSPIQGIVDVVVSSLPFSLDAEGQQSSAGQLVVAQSSGVVACLRRSDYGITSVCPAPSESDDCILPAPKKAKSEYSAPLVVSPAGCCAAYFSPSCLLTLVQCGGSLLDSPAGGTSDVYIQLLVGVLYGTLVTGQSAWDLTIYLSRRQKQSGSPLLSTVMAELERVFFSQIPLIQRTYSHQFCVLKSTLVRCLSDGMLKSLDVLENSKLFAAFGFLVDSLHPAEGGKSLVEAVGVALSEAPAESILETVTSSVTTSVSVGSAVFQATQLAVKWLMEFTARVVYRIANQVTERIPDKYVLTVLQQLLVLLDKLQPSLPAPKCQNLENTLACFFKILSLHLANPSAIITSEAVPDIGKLPREDQHQELSHRNAVYLQGFLHGLSMAELPELYSTQGCGIRRNVLDHQDIVHPFTPFTLEVPRGLPPIWASSTPEGERDVVKGNLIPNTALQKAGLLQCSRCHGWSIAGITQLMEKFTPIASVWDQLWVSRCPCGGQWSIRETSSLQ